METRVKTFGHPIHPMLIVFPFGLLATAAIFDILYLIFNNPDFPIVSFYMIAAGVIGGLTAALFGFLDWLGIPSGTRARSIGLIHGIGNVTIVVLFAISWSLRLNAAGYIPSTFALICSFAGLILAMITGWLGGELVYRLGMAVDRGANLDASSSLSGEPAGARNMGMGARPVIPQTGRPPDEDNPDRR